MSIRLRKVNGILIALCAARSVEKDGDIYLDDNAHHALAEKFARDYNKEGRVVREPDSRAAEGRCLMCDKSGDAAAGDVD